MTFVLGSPGIHLNSLKKILAAIDWNRPGNRSRPASLLGEDGVTVSSPPAADGLERRFGRAFLGLAGPDWTGLVLVAFSGGADSTALLTLLAALRPAVQVAAAHLDHGLRGAEGERDRLWAEKAAEEAGVPFYWEKADVRALARAKSLSLEDAARRARYDFLSRVKERIDAGLVAVGHTADDNAEAVLINLLRGAGPQGLAGMPPVRPDGVIRPLLGFRRRELIGYLNEKGLSWVEDSSNSDPAFTRNRVRTDLLPRLAADYNPAVKEALVRTAEVLRAEEEIWAGFLEKTKKQIGWRADPGQGPPERIYMDRAGLTGLPIGAARRLARAAAAEILGETLAIGLDHVDASLDAARRESRIDLPRGLAAWTEADRFVLGRPLTEEIPDYEYRLDVPGRIVIAEIGQVLTADLQPDIKNLDPAALGPGRCALDLDCLAPPLVVRPARPGDRFRPLGLGGTRKLSDFFIDLKIPRRKRSSVPLVEDAQGLVWVGGLRPDERAKVTPRTARAVILTLEPSGESSS